MPARHRGWLIAGAIVAVVILGVVIATFFADEPLRRYAEGVANESLPDYRVTIGALDLHPLTLAVDLRDVVIRQEAHPEPPLAVIPEARADARVLPLFSGTVGVELSLDKPVLSITRPQLDAALHKTDEVKEEAAAWQDRVRELMPFHVTLSLRDGEAIYEGPPPAQPIHVKALAVTAQNVTNRPDDGERYPARLQVSAQILEEGRLSLDGRADPLAKPSPAVQAQVRLGALPVAAALQALGKTEVLVKEGTLEATAQVDYGPANQAVTVEQVTVLAPKIDYAAHPESEKAAKDVEAVADTAKAWQDRVAELLPITVRQASVQNGEVLYRPKADGQAIHVHRLDVSATNLRNRPAEPDEYPSDFRVAARVAEESDIAVDGHADFLAKPLPRVEAQVKVQDLHLGRLRPVAEPFNVQLRRGVLDVRGRVYYSHHKAIVVIDHFLLEGAKVDYVHASETKDKEAARAKRAAQRTKEARREPVVLVKVEHGKILHSEVGYVNASASPHYRVFMADMNVEMDNFSTRPQEGTGVVKVTGKFMGSGPTTVIGTFRPEKPRPDFELEARILKTQVKALNPALRAHGGLDTAGGTFSFFGEFKVKNNRIDGYVKPFLKDIEVYDPAQDKDKAMTKKLYEAVVGGVLGLFENEPRDEVATKTEVSGEVGNPQADTWQLVTKLVQNAFFNAILPGLEGREARV